MLLATVWACALVPPLLAACLHLLLRDRRRRASRGGRLLPGALSRSSSVSSKPHPSSTRSSLSKSDAHPSRTHPEAPTQLEADKSLYHRLQNLSSYPSALPEGRHRLLQLLDATVASAQSSPANTILSVPLSSVDTSLPSFLVDAGARAAEAFDAYLARRKAGGPREMLQDRAHGEFWIRAAAPVKYVDGAWLGGVHRASTPRSDRKWTRTAWQILSEELGDGDLAKNHVHVYQQLVDSIGIDIGRGDEKRFIDDSTNPNDDERVWTAAVAQLCVSLCPHEFLPEILGFNLAYESLPLHLLVTIHELKELRLDPYYFVLHVVIDNADSGHAAMGLAAVLGLLHDTPPEHRETTWKRVQAGFILAEGLPTTPTPPTDTETRLMAVFARKCVTSRPMHVCCSAKIGGRNGRTLSQWLDPASYHQHAREFLHALKRSRWVVRGRPECSRLLAELKWGGRMFGAFTAEEVALVARWIEESALKGVDVTPECDGAYTVFVGRSLECDSLVAMPSPSSSGPVERTPCACRPAPQTLAELLDTPGFPLHLDNTALGSLLIVSAAPFERLPSLPAKCGTPKGMAAVRVLRALYGFRPETGLVSGMDEVALDAEAVPRGVVEIGHSLLGGRTTPPSEVVRSEVVTAEMPLVDYVMACSLDPERNYDVLVGVQLGFVAVLYRDAHAWEERGADEGVRERLREVARRCEDALEQVVAECAWESVCAGFVKVRHELGGCVVDAGGGAVRN